MTCALYLIAAGIFINNGIISKNNGFYYGIGFGLIILAFLCNIGFIK
jgi:hypothetical protein